MSSAHSLENLDVSSRVLVCLACLGDAENAFDLFQFGPAAIEKSLIEATQMLMGIVKTERKRFISKELEKISKSAQSQFLGDIHSGWFLEGMKKESPRVVQLILHSLPTDKTKYILEHMPRELKNKIDLLSPQKHPIAEAALRIIQKRFESYFPKFQLPHPSGEVGLHHIYFIKTSELLSFFRELGIEQLGKAFKSLPKEALKALIYRLPVRDAREFQLKMKSLQNVSQKELQEARMIVLQVSLDTMNPDELFCNVGILFFAKCLSKDEKELIKALQLKLEPKYGYLFRRHADQNLASVQKAETEWFKKQILDRFKVSPSVAGMRGR